ncbi:MAG TPA: glycosyltransferase family 4 protein [Kineosporiaceae bacterium]
MRILHVTDAYLPKQGGIEVQVHDLAVRQLLAGHEVAVMTCAPAEEPDPPGGEDRPSGPRVHRVRTPWGRIRRTNTMIYEHYRRERPDVVHVHLSVLSPLAILAVRAAARAGVPVLATLHSLWWWATPLYWIADKLIHWSAWRVHWSAVSRLAADPLQLVLRRRSEVTILPNGVEPTAWAVEPVERDPSEVVVVSVMRLAARKRPRALLTVVRKARARLPHGVRLKVIIVGDGPLRRKLGRDIARQGVQNQVVLAGRLERDQIRELYRRADIYIAPAILESFGIAALEARCAGIPVIARRQTGIADFIRTGEHGLLTSSDSGMADALAGLASTPQVRAAMARRNRASAPETGWADVLQRCELAYKVAHELITPRSRERAPQQ